MKPAVPIPTLQAVHQAVRKAILKPIQRATQPKQKFRQRILRQKTLRQKVLLQNSKQAQKVLSQIRVQAHQKFLLQPTGFENEISGNWSAQRITDANGNEISGEELYGSSYRIYGGTIQFNDNGTFSLRMGVSSDDTSSQGTFTYEGENEIQLHFYDDSTSKCYIENNAGVNTITMPFVIFGDTFTVSFTMD